MYLSFLRRLLSVFLIAASSELRCEPSPRVQGGWQLAVEGVTPSIVVEEGTDKAIARAAGDLAGDIGSVTGLSAHVGKEAPMGRGKVIVVGVIGRSPLIDRAIADGKLDVSGVAGKWESNVIEIVKDPAPGISEALVVAGSDKRGAIYGLYSLSEEIGVSPWAWWADVPIAKRSELWISSAPHKLSSPTVKYRGVFLNDEDWGLRPWASKTFDPATGNIGPKTYAKIFELLLRLRANTLWPAMHPGTRAFNYYPDDKVVASDYGIIMGSSHAEPMLRDNVDEWARDASGEFDYGTNRDNVLSYWEKRVRENAPFESIYTIGMRGIHDGPMAGGGSIDEKAMKLKRIMEDQRAMLSKWVNPNVDLVPQMFCPYKEVLPIYEHAPQIVPDSAILEWPDDNYGYIQHYSTEAERSRSGGAGVYYHVSYWGRPYDYLWLCTTPPALIGEEMSKALAYGAKQLWILNVGDLKPAEIDMEFFLRLAWDPETWTPEHGQHAFLKLMFTRDFGSAYSEEMASIMDEYYRLNFQRKPEHMGIDLHNRFLSRPAFDLELNPDETNERLEAFRVLSERAIKLGDQLPDAFKAAYFELVLYPVKGAALMNVKGIALGVYYSPESDAAKATNYYAKARTAQDEIDRETSIFNNQMDGKWRGMMSDAPREQLVFSFPKTEKIPDSEESRSTENPKSTLMASGDGRVVLKATDATANVPGADTSWRTVAGIGYSGASLVALPETAPSRSSPTEIKAGAPRLEYKVWIQSAGDWKVVLRGPPTWPVDRSVGLRYAVAFDDEPLQLVARPRYRDEFDPAWQEDVLRNAAFSSSVHRLSSGWHTLKIWRADPGLILDALLVVPSAHPMGSYDWPAERQVAPVTKS